MARAAAQRIDPKIAEAQKRILRWREGGPALFAVEALGVPAKWDEKLREGVQEWQWKASRQLVARRRLSVRAGRRVGKSAFMSWAILWFMSCYFPCKIPCTAPTSHQLSDVLWAEVAKWMRGLRIRHPELAAQYEMTRDEIRLVDAPKESFAVARTAREDRPEALQGFQSDHVLMLIDEATGVADVIWETGQGSLAGPGSFVIFAANPTKTNGFFYETHHKMRDRWACIHVNGEDCPLQDQEYRDSVAQEYGKDSNVYKVHIQGDFPNEADDVVISLSLCEAAKIREVEPFGDEVWGIDVARFGDDRTVLTRRCDNATLAKHEAWHGTDLMQTSGKIYAKWLATEPRDRPKMIFVDVIGIGAGVADRLMELGLPVCPVNVAESASIDDTYNRLRDELWFKMRKWLEKKSCKLFDDDTLIAELTLPRYAYVSSGKIKVESKDELKKRYPRSPDCADSLALTFCHVAEHRGRAYYEPEVYADS